jgi:hypothetical protein
MVAEILSPDAGNVQRLLSCFGPAVVAATATLSLALSATASSRDYAHHYASQNFAVVPTIPGKKAPFIKDHLNAATTDAATIDAWWGKWPDAGVGCVPTGWWCVIDIDGQPGMDFFLAHVSEGSIPRGPRVQTGRGWHLVYRVPAALIGTLGNIAKGKVEFWVEPRKRFLVWPPSIHPNGATYRWHDADLPIPDLPTGALAWLLAEKTAAPTRPNVSHPVVGRQNDLYRMLCGMREKGAPDSVIAAAAEAQNAEFTDGPLPTDELNRTVRQVCKFPLGSTIDKARTPGATMTIRRYDGIAAREKTWGWHGVLPRRTLSTIVGEPGLGKSLITVDLAARLTRGDWMPTGAATDYAGPTNVLMIAVEDDPEDTIKPRLAAAGADMARVFDIRMRVNGQDDVGGLPTFPDDVTLIYELVMDQQIGAVFIDPITACLSDDVNSWKDSEVRRALTPLITLARKADAMVVGVMHVNKDENASAINRVGSSKAFTALPRAVWGLGLDPENNHPVMVPIKLNGAPMGSSYGFAIMQTAEGIPFLTWDEAPGKRTAADLTRRPEVERRDAKYEAVMLLWTLLREGPQPSELVRSTAAGRGVSNSMLLRVANELGVQMTRSGEFHAGTEWRWPGPTGIV